MKVDELSQITSYSNGLLSGNQHRRLEELEGKYKEARKTGEAYKMHPMEYEEMKALNTLRNIYTSDNTQYNLNIIA